MPDSGSGVGVPVPLPAGVPSAPLAPCVGRYAEAWQFASFWCVSNFLSRVDNSGGAGNAALTDTTVNFVTLGVIANVGMVLYNLTTNLSGPVTAVTATTITATGVLWSNGDQYRITLINAMEIAQIEQYLDITGADVSSAVAAQDACDCTFQSWVAGYLAKINLIEAAMFYNCNCASPKLSEDMKNSFIEWANTQLELIRNGDIILCEGDSGRHYPAIGYAEIAHTVWEEAEILQNYILKNSP